jgi:hypothetical protein
MKNLIAELTAHIIMDQFIDKAEEESRNLIKKGMEIAGVEIDIDKDEEATIDFIQNGPFEYLNMTNKNELESTLVILERGSDKFITGCRVKIDVENMRIGRGKMEIKDGVDPVAFGQMLKSMGSKDSLVH